MSEPTPTDEIKVKIDGQWYYRGNRSSAWFALASRADGSASGIAEKMPAQTWFLLATLAAQRTALLALSERIRREGMQGVANELEEIVKL